mgnify:CR=1 FL=1
MLKFIRPFYICGVFAALFCLSTTGCEVDVEEGPVEEAAEEVDQAVEEVGDGLEGDGVRVEVE